MLKTFDRERSRNQSQQYARLRIVGEIHKGSPKKIVNGKEIQGDDLDYFRFEAKGTPEEQAAIATAFASIYGDRPTVINFYTLADTPEQALDAWFWEFAKINKKDSRGKAKIKCNGDEIVGWCDPNTQKWLTEPRPCRRSPDELHCSMCKPSAKMELMIPELWQAGYMGYVLFHVSSFAYDYPEILSNLEAIAQTRAIFGKTLKNAPLQLCRAIRTVSTSYPDKENPERRIPKLSEKSLCYITQPAEHVQQLVQGLKQRQVLTESVQPQLALPARQEILSMARSPISQIEDLRAKAERFYKALVSKVGAIADLESYNRLYTSVYSEDCLKLWAALPDQGACVNLLMDDLRSRLSALLKPSATIETEIKGENSDEDF